MGSRIEGISYYLPKSILNNDMLAEIFPNYTAKKLYRKLGITDRHIAYDESVSDMAVKAAEQLLDDCNVDREEIDFLILCTESGDYPLPHTSAIIQERLGLSTKTGALDINLGCSGYVYCLGVVKGLIQTGIAKKVLVITSEKYSSYIDKEDSSTRTIFGDGASATLIGYSEEEHLEEFVFGTDGSGVENLIVKDRQENRIFMDGTAVFQFSMNVVPDAITTILEKGKINLEEIDFVVPHQANAYMLRCIQEIVGISDDKYIIDLEEMGNTVSSTIPIALARGIKSGKMKSGTKLLLVGFGVGYSWGAALVTL